MAAGMIIVRVDGLDELRAKLRSERAEPAVTRFLDRVAIFIQGRMRVHIQRNGSIDLGDLIGSIAVEPRGKHERSIGSNKDHAIFVEEGTRPHWPPISAITPWARRHKIEPFLVARSIAMKGTEAKPFMRPAAQEGEAVIKTLVPVLAAEIEADFAR